MRQIEPVLSVTGRFEGEGDIWPTLQRSHMQGGNEKDCIVRYGGLYLHW